jgi:hypothetical protein
MLLPYKILLILFFAVPEPCAGIALLSGLSSASAVVRVPCAITRKPCIHAGPEKHPPPFTLRLFANFVNGKRPVSTGFLPFLPVFIRYFWILAHSASLKKAAKPLADAACKRFLSRCWVVYSRAEGTSTSA